MGTRNPIDYGIGRGVNGGIPAQWWGSEQTPLPLRAITHVTHHPSGFVAFTSSQTFGLLLLALVAALLAPIVWRRTAAAVSRRRLPTRAS